MTPRLLKCLGILVGSALLWPALGASPAAASPIDDARREAASLQRQIDANAERVAAVDRQLRSAEQRAAEADQSVARAQAELAGTNDRYEAARGRMARRAVTSYIKGGAAPVIEQFSRSTGSDLTVRRHYVEAAAGGDRRVSDDLKATRQDLVSQRQRLDEARARAQAETARISGQRADLAKTEAAQQGTLRKVQGQLTSLVAEEQARRNAEAERRAQAALAAARAAAVVPAPTGLAPAPSRPAPGTTAAAVRLPASAPAVASAAPGGVWACIRQLESSNNYRAPGGGAYQILESTWRSLGQSGRAEDAPPDLQDAMAIQLQRRSGWSQWTVAPRCGVG